MLRAAVADGRSDDEPASRAFAPAEAQAAAVADDIAYCSHDLDDGLRAGLIRLDDLAAIPLAGEFVPPAVAARSAGGRRVIYEVNRRIITVLIDDVVRSSRARLAALLEPSLESVRAAGRPVIAASAEMAARIDALKAHLTAHVYRHPRVMRVVAGAEAIVRDLFARYLAEPALMPELLAPGRARRHERAGSGGRGLRFRGRHDRPLRHRPAPPPV